MWQELFDAGRIDHHPVFPGKPGYASRRIESDDDVIDVIELIRLNYDRAVATHGLPKDMQTEIEGLHALAPEALPFAPAHDIRAFLLRRDAGNLLIYSTTAVSAGDLESRGWAASRATTSTTATRRCSRPSTSARRSSCTRPSAPRWASATTSAAASPGATSSTVTSR